jgi:hypothetical protein
MTSISTSESIKKIPVKTEKIKKPKEKKPTTLAELLQWRISRLEKREQRLVKAVENHKKNQKLCESKLEKVKAQKQAETKAIGELVAKYKATPT